MFALVPCVQNFGAPSFDDKKLEVVAVFGSMQMAMSRVINLQHHRIAQVTHTHVPANNGLYTVTVSKGFTPSILMKT